jgi:hypothetical protein
VIAPTEREILSLAVLDAYDARPAGAGPERRYCCPLSGCRDKPVDRQHQSLCVNIDSGLWTCNRCTARGKLSDRWDDRSVAEIRRRQDRARTQLTPEPQPGRADSAPMLAPLVTRCVPLAGTLGHSYLVGRGIGLAVAKPAGVTFCADVYGRPGVVFPMHDRTGQLVAVNVRYTDGRTDPKARSVADRSLGVFATPGALAIASPLVVVEGPMDALSLAACGVPTVALACTRAPRWLRTAAAFRRVLVALDADAEGDKASVLLEDEVQGFAESVERLRPPVGKDWNDALMQMDYQVLRNWLAERCA